MARGGYIAPPRPHPVRENADRDSGGGWAEGAEDARAEFLRQVASLEGRPDTFRAMTSLDVDEAHDLYREAASAAEARADRERKRRRGGGRGGGKGGAARRFPPYEVFLMALVMVRKPDDNLVDFVFRMPPGTARAALDAVLPSLFELRNMPRRFARHLVPLGYSMPANPKRGKGSGNILDYMGGE